MIINDLSKFIIATVYDDYYRDWDYNMKKDKNKKKKENKKKKGKKKL